MHAFKLIVGMGILLGGTSAQAEWRRYETQHFIIYSEAGDAKATERATKLEKVDALMRMATGLSPQEEPVKVRIYELGDEGDVEAALGPDSEGVAGFYTSNILGPYAVTVRRLVNGEDMSPEVVLHHEYAHHFMLQYFPANYPLWYSEGFAELIGASKFLDDGRIGYGFPAKYRGGLIGDVWVPVSDIVSRPEEKVPPYDVYGQGWVMTHFLTFTKGRSQQLRQYLAALEAGKSPPDAAKAFGDLHDLDRDAHIYVLKGSFDYKPVDVKIQQPVVQRVTPVGAAEAALIPETIAFNDFDLDVIKKPGDRDRERKRRQTTLERVRSKAAKYPGDPYALYLLAQIENASGSKQAAEAAADRLLAIQPGHVGGMIIKSMLLSDQAAALNGAARLQKAEEARHLAMAANKADPDNPLTYVAFYRSYPAAGVAAPAAAVDGLSAAVAKLPKNDNVREMLVDELTNEGKFADAIFVLSPIANDPHDSPLRQAAREKMEALKARAGAASAQTAAKS